MTSHRQWFDRRFESGLPPEAFPEVLERLRGTPARIEDLLNGVPANVLVQRFDEKWSIQENAGHLLDLEPLWEKRLEELLAGAPKLRAADLENRKTHEADHNSRQLHQILAAFRKARTHIVRRLEELSGVQLRATALHPRLQQPMTTVDLFFFIAEHDDHHLARITEILKLVGDGNAS